MRKKKKRLKILKSHMIPTDACFSSLYCINLQQIDVLNYVMAWSFAIYCNLHALETKKPLILDYFCRTVKTCSQAINLLRR